MSLNSLMNQRIEDVVPQQQQLITCDSRDPIPKSFKTLVQNDIWSAPVLDKSKREYIGFIDMIDIVTYIVKIIEDQKTHLTAIERDFPDEQDFYSLLEQVERFDLTSTDKIADISKRNPMCPIRARALLDEACKVFVNTKAHRLPVLSSPWHISHVLSQLDVIVWLSQHLDELGDLGKRTIREMSIGFKPVISTSLEATTLDAFKMMVDNNVNSIAVINKENVLVGNISAKDIKKLAFDPLFTRVNKSVHDFLTHENKEVKDMNPPIYCTMDSSFKEVIATLGNKHVHRIYIVNEHKQPIGVISLIDIIRELSDYYAGEKVAESKYS